MTIEEFRQQLEAASKRVTGEPIHLSAIRATLEFGIINSTAEHVFDALAMLEELERDDLVSSGLCDDSDFDE